MPDPRFDSLREAGGERYAAFLAAGYREWYSGAGRSTPFLLQKCIRNDGGDKLYFVNVWVYDWREHGDRMPTPISYAAEVQFNTRDAKATFDVSRGWDRSDVAEIEAFYAKVYEAMGCEPYERSDD